MNTNLNEVNPVIIRYSKDNNISVIESKNHFIALNDFLNLASNSKHPCFPDKTIDEAWHTLIIHTKLYENYCKTNFSKFIHHNPIDKLEKPVLGYKCSYNLKTKKMDFILMSIDQAVCDGGGGSCSSCGSDN